RGRLGFLTSLDEAENPQRRARRLDAGHAADSPHREISARSRPRPARRYWSRHRRLDTDADADRPRSVAAFALLDKSRPDRPAEVRVECFGWTGRGSERDPHCRRLPRGPGPDGTRDENAGHPRRRRLDAPRLPVEGDVKLGNPGRSRYEPPPAPV